MIYDIAGNVIDNWFIGLVDKYDGFGLLLYVILTLIITAILSALIGLERYRMGENAGIRTHALLSIGCSFLMVISMWAIKIPNPGVSYDLSRIAAASVTGIGFLGAGVIIKDKFTVKGLSTATTLWICAAIGLATGAGFVLEAIVAALFTMLVVYLRNKMIVRVDQNAPHVVITAKKGFELIVFIKDICDKNSFNVKNIDIESIDDEKIIVRAYFPYKINPLILEYLMNELKKNENILDTKKIMKREGAVFTSPHES